MSTRNHHPGQLLTAPGTFKSLKEAVKDGAFTGREHYTMTFGADAPPPADRSRGGSGP